MIAKKYDSPKKREKSMSLYCKTATSTYENDGAKKVVNRIACCKETHTKVFGGKML